MKHDILEDIIAHKQVPLQTLLGLASEAMDRNTVSMRESLENSTCGIIAEFKRKSPSKGWLHPKAKVSDIIPAYQANEAAACSILTDELFFGGSLGDLKKARRQTSLPLLRKDFILESYQLFQAKAMGADAVLLILESGGLRDTCQHSPYLRHGSSSGNSPGRRTGMSESLR